MKATCPQCGKVMNVSLEELSQRDGLVVCPQCLSAYQAVEPSTLPADEQSRGKANETAPVMHYCPHCGQSIGTGINYCPYCGRSLHVPETSAVIAATPVAAQHIASDRRSPDSNHADAHQSPNDPSNKSTSTQTFDWKPMIPSYRMSRLRQYEPASRGFQAFAYATIIALLALLAFIIYHARLLS